LLALNLTSLHFLLLGYSECSSPGLLLATTEEDSDTSGAMMPNPFDTIMFVLLAIGALQQMGWLPW